MIYLDCTNNPFRFNKHHIGIYPGRVTVIDNDCELIDVDDMRFIYRDILERYSTPITIYMYQI